MSSNFRVRATSLRSCSPRPLGMATTCFRTKACRTSLASSRRRLMASWPSSLPMNQVSRCCDGSQCYMEWAEEEDACLANAPQSTTFALFLRFFLSFFLSFSRFLFLFSRSPKHVDSLPFPANCCSSFFFAFADNAYSDTVSEVTWRKAFGLQVVLIPLSTVVQLPLQAHVLSWNSNLSGKAFSSSFFFFPCNLTSLFMILCLFIFMILCLFMVQGGKRFALALHPFRNKLADHQQQLFFFF
jgi:hypothetical protein